MIEYEVGHATDVGRIRDHNEDHYRVDPQGGLFIISDGMGGHAAGEVASAITVDAIADGIRRGYGLVVAMRMAHHAVLDASHDGRGQSGMGATAVALHIQGSEYQIAWVGDSRAYLWDKGLCPLTTDHSFVQELVDSGALTEAEAANRPDRSIITQALGVTDTTEVTVDEICGQLYHGQKVLLCSDGLTCEITDHQIGAIISAEGSNQEIVESLIHAANTRGGEDNITAILISSPEDSPIKPRNGNGRRLYTTTLNRMLEGKKELKSGSAIVIGVLALVAACLLTYFLV